MKKIIESLISKKNILILGFGREGRSTLKLLKEVGGYKSITIADAKNFSSELPEDIHTVSTDRYLDCLDEFDVVFKSPGVVLKKPADEYLADITSQTEIFIQAYKDKVIGITGTKGKSTTSSFIAYVLKESGKNVLFAGNIGIPVFDIANQVTDDSIIVLELSCHQLEYAKTSPHIAVLLNVYEDHLDHYITREKYGLAKKNIYRFQNDTDLLFTIEEVTREWGEAKARTTYVAAKDCPVKSFEDCEGTSFRGEHNLLNVSFAYNVCKEYGVEDETFIKAVASFKTLPHRLEPCGKINGVDYYDDSISTTVKSAISAVESIDNAAFLLAGGMERNLVYDELIEYVKLCRLKYLVCMYESGRRIFEMYINATGKNEKSPKAVYVENLEEAVSFVKENAKPGDAVLLSPAAASYGYFKNFEERGDVFKELIKKS